jgi:hypothetical protein
LKISPLSGQHQKSPSFHCFNEETPVNNEAYVCYGEMMAHFLPMILRSHLCGW